MNNKQEMNIQQNVNGNLGPNTRRITSWKRAEDPKERLYSVKYNKDGSPIVHTDRNGLSRKAKKRKEKELLKGYTRREIREMREKARIESAKLFKQKMKRIDQEVREEIRQEDTHKNLSIGGQVEGGQVDETRAEDVATPQ